MQIRHRKISWAEELVLEPSRVRTCSEGSILNKDGNDWSIDHYLCDCGVIDCDCDETFGAIHPEWVPRNIQELVENNLFEKLKTKNFFFFIFNRKSVELSVSLTKFNEKN